MKRQQFCVLLAALATVAAGMGMVYAAKECPTENRIFLEPMSLSPTFSITALGVILCISGTLGVFGAACSTRAALLAYGLPAFVASSVGLIIGLRLLASVNSQSLDIETACLRSRGPENLPAGWSKWYENNYEQMATVLSSCRLHVPSALSLNACLQAGVGSVSDLRQTATSWDLFEWLESHGACSGFCFPGTPLFAGDVRSPCFRLFAEEVQARGNKLAGLTIGASFAAFLGVCCTACTIFFPWVEARIFEASSGSESE